MRLHDNSFSRKNVGFSASDIATETIISNDVTDVTDILEVKVGEEVEIDETLS